MDEIGSVAVRPELARVYVEGWQSWSPAGLFQVRAPPPPVTNPESLVIDWHYGRSAPEGAFQGAGVLAVDSGDGAAPVLFGAASVASRVPVIQAVLRGERLVVSADEPVTQVSDAGPGGIVGTLGRWADRLGAAGGLRAVPPDPRLVAPLAGACFHVGVSLCVG